MDLPNLTKTSAPELQKETTSLKKALEWELSLDSRDLRSHAWYHGSVSRHRAEEIVQREGEFLIRDCASQPGNYVLTCRTKISVLHFVINKIILQPETVYERIQYQFEDDAYDTVPDLITFYVGSGKSISIASGARIQFPCNRTYPLSFYGNKLIGSSQYSLQQNQGNYNNYRSPLSSPPRTKRETPPRLPSKKYRSQSLTSVQASMALNIQNTDKYCRADGKIQPNGSASLSFNNSDEFPEHLNGSKFVPNTTNPIDIYNSADGIIEQNQPNGNIKDIVIKSVNEKSSSADDVLNTITTQIMSRSAGNTNINTKSMFNSKLPSKTRENFQLSSFDSTSNFNHVTSESPSFLQKERNTLDENNCSQHLSPPLKPLRTPTLKSKEKHTKNINVDQQHSSNRVTNYHASGSDSGNGSGDSAHSSATGDNLEPIQRGVIIRNPRFMTNSASSMTLKSFSDFDISTAEQELISMEFPVIEQISKFDLENFHTLLLPAVENKPLDNGALNTIQLLLAESGSRIIAQHLTRIDIKLILEDTNISKEKNILSCSGLEMLTLPYGQNFRQDLIERTQCLTLLVAITILTCQNDYERAVTLNKWIQIAVDTKTALGNLFGFCAIMFGLCMPQIQKLDSTWHILRQKFTDSAFTFEAKLRPTLKSMNDCSNPQAPNTTIPHLLPYIILKDRCMEDILTAINPHQTLITSCVSPWEINADDFGISVLFLHLDSARGFTKNLSLYKKNSNIIIEDLNPRFDNLLSDVFRTEFLMKFLWGSKGAVAPAEFRHSKLEQIITLMAEKFYDHTENAG